MMSGYPTQGLIAFNTLRLRQNGRHFADDIFKCIFLNENVWISAKMSLKFVPKGPINNISTLVQIMAWRHPGDKLLSEPMMVRLPMHICVTRPQWVNHITMNHWTMESMNVLIKTKLLTFSIFLWDNIYIILCSEKKTWVTNTDR